MNFAEKIKALFRRNKLGEETFEDLTDLLIEGDIGAALAFEIVDSLKAACKKEGISDPDAAKAKLKELLRPYIKTATF